MMKSQGSEFYTDMIDALQLMGFESIEMNFYRRVENIDDSQLAIYCELLENQVEVSLYEDSYNVESKRFSSAIDFIDYVESILSSYNIEAVTLASTRIRRNSSITAKSNFTTKDFIKKLIRVKSSNMWSYAYQPKDNYKGDVLIQFKGANGGPDDIYIYYDVPAKTWQKLVAAPSKGHAFWVLIRNVFKYAKLTGDKRTHLPNGI